ncbi:MAG: formyltransferase family protein [Dehalococcoidia bacterium]|jgi:phosphoribosylglycinamide formyltransferase-1
MTLRIGWFSTGRGQDAINLLAGIHDAIRGRALDASIEYVFCNRERGEHEVTDRFLDFTVARGLRVVCKSSARFEPELRRSDREAWRPLYDSEVLSLLTPFEVDVSALAGYMLITSPLLHERFLMLNLHPAKPDGPTGRWEDVMWQIIADREKEAGAMINIVMAELDRGPTVAYCTFPTVGGAFDALWRQMDAKLATASLAEIRAREGYGEPLFAAIRAAEFAREIPLLLGTLTMIADGRIRFEGRQVFVDGRPSREGLCLNAWLEE